MTKTKTARAAALGTALVATVLMLGCTTEAGPVEDASNEPSDPVSDSTNEDVEQSSSELNSAGQFCRATCRSTVSGWRYCYINRTITSGCRDWAVNACHSRGLSFVDAAWTWWGC